MHSSVPVADKVWILQKPPQIHSPHAHSCQNTNTKIILVCQECLSSSLSLGRAAKQCSAPSLPEGSLLGGVSFRVLHSRIPGAHPIWKGLLLCLSSSLAPGFAALLHEGWAGRVSWGIRPACLPVGYQRRGLRCWLRADCTHLHPRPRSHLECSRVEGHL